MRAVEEILGELGRDPGCFRIVLIHHPPHVGGAEAGRNLTDASRFEKMLCRVGAELVLHGHNHVGSLAHLDGPRGPIPVIGAPSASARSGTLTHKAGYHLFTIGQDETGFLLAAELRGLKPDGTVGGMGMLTRAHPPANREVVIQVPAKLCSTQRTSQGKACLLKRTIPVVPDVFTRVDHPLSWPPPSKWA
jgi:hypothetical protein